MPDLPTVVCVMGPTACGKTTLAVLLAQSLGGEVVSCDSMQVYRGMTIGTAAPTAQEMCGVPHHMVGVLDPHEDCSAARFCEMACACIDDILVRGKTPILAGGTGLYLDSILAGRRFAPGETGGETRRMLEARRDAEGIDALREELCRVDPERAARLAPADEKRILRALEVWYETGETITAHDVRSRGLPPRYRAVKLGLAFEDRADMKALIDRRVDGMLSAGLFDEVRALLDAGVPRDSTALQAIGYKECLAFLDGTESETQAAEEIKLRSRQYAKRQLTWLRRDADIHWYTWKKTRDFQSALQFSTEILRQYGVC